MKKLYSLILFISLLSCQKEKEQVDTIVYNANVYTVNAGFELAEAFAVKDGKFLEVGTTQAIQSKYQAHKKVDAQGQTVLPGLIDAHCHFYGLGVQQNRVDLVGTKSFDEVMKRVLDFQNSRQVNFIIGRGWDQNDWEDKTFPTKALLDKLFPEIPVALTRIDGHAMLCNQAALDLAGIDRSTVSEGGEIVKAHGELTGVLVDNPMELVERVYPKPTREAQVNALLEAQQLCVDLGLTTVSDAGLDQEVIELVDSLQKAGELKIRVYAMVSNTKENLDYYLTKGRVKTDRLNVQSVKVYSDGALGSRGAALKEPYTDMDNHYGAMIIGLEEFTNLANRIAASDYQMNTHAIGDSANSYVLKTYEKALQGKTDRRWRVEHAQVITGGDAQYFKNENIIPSVQPTHATSDMYWAEDRLGKERIKGAYAYKTLLDISGKVALGTDFPIEQVNPMLTFYATVARQDTSGFPDGGFQMKDALNREDALKGMTIWAAYANFEETEKGSIEAGKFADFILIDNDIMRVPIDEVPNTKVQMVFINGEEL